MKPPPTGAKSLKDTARSYSQSLASYGLIDIGLVAALETSALGMLTPVLPLYLKDEIGALPEQIGLTFTVFFIALAAGEFGWGMLSDRIGIKIPLMVGTMLAAITTAGFVLTKNINLLYVINFFRALGTSALFPTARGHIGSTIPLRSKATFMAYYMTLQSLGRTVGSFFGGIIGEQSMEMVFIIAGLALIAAFTVTSLSFKSDVFKVKKPEPAGDTSDPPARFSRSALMNLVILGLTITMFNLTFTVRNSFLPLHAVDAASATVAQVGYLFSAWGLITLICTLPLGHLADRLGYQRAMTIGQLILAVTMAGFAYAHTFTFMLLIMVVNSLSNCVFRPAAAARFSQLMPRRRQATAMGILGVFEDVGNMIGPAVAGFIWGGVNGPALTFLLGSACATLGAGLSLVKPRGQKSS
ncbi:MAG: MFS transporter [Chloroflexota bacterium]